MRMWAALAGVVALAATGAASAAHELPEMAVYEASNSLGTMEYRVFAPAGLQGRVPLFVHIHGGNVSVVDVSHQSRLNELASARGFVVVYPQEDPSINAGIWDGEAAAAEGRGSRASSLIAQITRAVVADYPVDARRVFVGGISAGMVSVAASVVLIGVVRVAGERVEVDLGTKRRGPGAGRLLPGHDDVRHSQQQGGEAGGNGRAPETG
jgi:poly(3-hydroxybutyrate) depolymerase